MNIKIDNEFKTLIPPLTEEEFGQLEANCIENGIQDSLKVWEDILIDGHNRYEIAVKHGLEFKTDEMEFSGRDDVKLWIIKNQLGRRNLDKWDRFDLAKSLEAIEHNLAKERQGTRTDLNIKLNLAESKGQTRDKMAEKVGVSHGTYDKMKVIDESDNEEVKRKVRSKDISIDKAYREVKGIPDKPKKIEPLPFEEEHIELIEAEESQEDVEDVVADVSNTFSESLVEALKANVSRVTGMDHFYRADVLSEIKKLDLPIAEKEDLKNQIKDCIKYLIHIENGLTDW